MAQPKGLLHSQVLRGPFMISVQSGPKQFAGRTTINSGDATVTVSTFAVMSDSLITYGVEGAVNQSSGVATYLEVKSISDQNFFTLGWADGSVAVPKRTLMWQVTNTSHH